MQTLLYTKVIERLRHYSWRRIFEDVGPIKGLLLRGSLLVTGHFTVEAGLAVCHLSKQIKLMSKRSGLLFTALYLKQCAVVLQRHYALQNPKETLRGQQFDVRVSLARSGLPRIIPKIHRNRILVKDDRADRLVRLYLTWFSMAKVIGLAKPLRASSIRSITDPPKDKSRIALVIESLDERFKKLVDRYLPNLREHTLKKGISWIPSWKVPPNKKNPHSGHVSSIFGSITLELQALLHEDRWGERVIPSQGVVRHLAVKGELFPFDYKWNDHHYRSSGDHPRGGLGRYKPDIRPGGSKLEINYGRISSVVEGAGKRRLFCIGNFARQRVLAPFHFWFMDVLRMLPQDGTFDQEAPLFKLKPFKPVDVSSYDLKSATDRWPVSFSSRIVKCIFGAKTATLVVDFCLASASFTLGPPVIRGPRRRIKFGCGQPLGYYSSWALFALSHHFLVWMAADDVYPDAIKPFRGYALLGDDIVITDKAVALRYRHYLTELGVDVSIPKSIVSDTGALEFAKRYWVKNLTVDCSPRSLKALMAARSTLGLCALGQKYTLPLNVVLRLGGAGFRVRARGRSQTSLKWKRLVDVYTEFTWDSPLPLEWWIAGGKPLSPYIHGVLLERVKEVFRPKDLILPPWILIDSDRLEMEERRLLHGWMSVWLQASLKYYILIQKGEFRLKEYFHLPLVQSSWQVSSYDEQVFKYGLFWRLVDQARSYPPYWGTALTPSASVQPELPAPNSQP